jgi:hypothetical protein
MSQLRGSGRRIALVTLIALGGGFMAVGLDRASAVAATSAAAAALATQVEGHLGLPGPASRSVARVTDGTTGLVVDEVTDLDVAGTPIAISRFDTSGQLVALVRLGFVAQVSPAIASTQALERATSILASLSVIAPGQPAITARATGGWLIRWVRLAGTVPVPGDGVSVQLSTDGSIHAIVRTERRLAPAPAARIDASSVRLLAGARLDRWFAGGLRGDASVTTVGLGWVAPNDTFGDPLPADTAGTLRLAWIVRVATTGALADQVAGLELAFDAGDGTALGGDLLE